MEKIKIIIVDNSAFMRKMIADIIESEPSLELIAKFGSGEDLLLKVDSYNPDIITLDANMRKLDGLSTLKELKKKGKNYPVIMLTSLTNEKSDSTLEYIENGAAGFVKKPNNQVSFDVNKLKISLLAEIMSIVNKKRINKQNKLNIKKIKTDGKIVQKSYNNIENNVKIEKRVLISSNIEAVVIGASTGGPKALQVVLPNLPNDLNVPVFVVQHMPANFTKAFAERLDKSCKMRVHEAEDGMMIEKNNIYIAKGGNHMVIKNKQMISLNDEPPIWGVKPAVDKLFNSASNIYKDRLLSVVLTGMGRDGANGTSTIKDNGGITISEDKSTCTIYGMPKAAYETGKVDYVLEIDKIAKTITSIVCDRR
ncbi:chemotaxis-specific protein-glutamate methyltransferase CheB [Clostridium sp. BJN0001]|uniref:chemotaxis-specific protein-glutamate methyltransferase CheB n=1 Tax=Clostridium sp. BJN0001 TaxID=2930219 RepID=UPI001FCF7EA2|nr:chemotaxis-specific protein-glutamate methyltransferase CheB [Clostridium sp. BJN0001]